MKIFILINLMEYFYSQYVCIFYFTFINQHFRVRKGLLCNLILKNQEKLRDSSKEMQPVSFSVEIGTFFTKTLKDT